MSPEPFQSSRSLSRICTAVLTCAAALAFAVPARAGIGDFAKKAKDKAAQTMGKKEQAAAAGDNKVAFDDVILELTAERLDRVVAAFKASSAASAGRPELVKKVNQASDEHRALLEKNQDKIQSTRQKRDEVESCLHDAYQEIREQRTEEYSQRALTDPAIREKFTRAAAEHNAAAARGDSAAIQSLQATLLAEVLPTREDSARVQQKCGPVPPRLPAEDKLDALDKQIASLSEQIRGIDEKAAEAQAEAGGMNRQQFAMAMERIQMYLDWRESKSYSKSSTRGFTQEEIEALEKRLEQLRAALG